MDLDAFGWVVFGPAWCMYIYILYIYIYLDLPPGCFFRLKLFGRRPGKKRKVNISIFQSMDSEQGTWKRGSATRAAIAAERCNMGANFKGMATAFAMRRNKTVHRQLPISVSRPSK